MAPILRFVALALVLATCISGQFINDLPSEDRIRADANKIGVTCRLRLLRLGQACNSTGARMFGSVPSSQVTRCCNAIENADDRDCFCDFNFARIYTAYSSGTLKNSLLYLPDWPRPLGCGDAIRARGDDGRCKTRRQSDRDAPSVDEAVGSFLSATREYDERNEGSSNSLPRMQSVFSDYFDRRDVRREIGRPTRNFW